MSWTILHNPRCSKSRQALALIKQHGIEPTVVRYLETPPTVDELINILERLGMKPRELMRKDEATYRELKLDDPQRSDEALIAAMIDHPILIERPIVVTSEKAIIGRPPEAILDLV